MRKEASEVDQAPIILRAPLVHSTLPCLERFPSAGALTTGAVLLQMETCSECFFQRGCRCHVLRCIETLQGGFSRSIRLAALAPNTVDYRFDECFGMCELEECASTALIWGGVLHRLRLTVLFTHVRKNMILKHNGFSSWAWGSSARSSRFSWHEDTEKNEGRWVSEELLDMPVSTKPPVLLAGSQLNGHA